MQTAAHTAVKTVLFSATIVFLSNAVSLVELNWQSESVAGILIGIFIYNSTISLSPSLSLSLSLSLPLTVW